MSVTYSCSKCQMAVNATCAKCKLPLNNTFITHEGQSIQVSQCSNCKGMIKSPLCCGQDMTCVKPNNIDILKVRQSIEKLLPDPNHDDGSWGPLFIRLAWHSSGTFCKWDNTGGSNGATMRFKPESHWDANAGLQKARDRLELVKNQFPAISYSDLWTLAGIVAVSSMGGPNIPWEAGRSDKASGAHCVPDGRLPDAAQKQEHLRDIFYKMGFNDQEIVALSGAHSVGRCHSNASGFEGPWTVTPTRFSNLYFKDLLHRKWRKKEWKGPDQFEDADGLGLMMLPSDIALLDDAAFKEWVQKYANDKDLFFKHFSSAFGKLLALGCPFKSKL